MENKKEQEFQYNLTEKVQYNHNMDYFFNYEINYNYDHEIDLKIKTEKNKNEDYQNLNKGIKKRIFSTHNDIFYTSIMFILFSVHGLFSSNEIILIVIHFFIFIASIQLFRSSKYISNIFLNEKTDQQNLFLGIKYLHSFFSILSFIFISYIIFIFLSISYNSFKYILQFFNLI